MLLKPFAWLGLGAMRIISRLNFNLLFIGYKVCVPTCVCVYIYLFIYTKGNNMLSFLRGQGKTILEAVSLLSLWSSTGIGLVWFFDP